MRGCGQKSGGAWTMSGQGQGRHHKNDASMQRCNLQGDLCAVCIRSLEFMLRLRVCVCVRAAVAVHLANDVRNMCKFFAMCMATWRLSRETPRCKLFTVSMLQVQVF